MVKNDGDTVTKACRDCGKVYPIAEYRVGKKRVMYRQFCRHCNAIVQREKDRQPGSRYSNAKSQCKQRGIIWTLPIDEWLELSRKKCTYCGGDLPELGRGLDRKVPDLGYVSGNVVPCCSLCNDIKRGLLTYEDMLIVGPAVTELQLQRKKRGEEPLRRNFTSKNFVRPRE